MANEKITYLPDWVSPPGSTLEETLTERGMTQVDLAQRIEMSRKHVKQMLNGDAPITPETAIKLERVLGIPARFWNNREQQYRDFLARKAEADLLTRKLAWLKQFKHLDRMVQLGWIPNVEDPVERIRGLLDFFGVASTDAWETHWKAVAVRYRKSYKHEPDRFALATWLRRGEIQAQDVECAPYDETAFRSALKEIRALTLSPPEVFQPALMRKCAACGVAVVFVPELPKTASGATRWLSAHKALIQLSLKYGTDDHLWFTFFHEAGHILLHRKSDIFIEAPAATSAEEEEANRFAAKTLVPPGELQRFLSEHAPLSKSRIETFARELGISPGIVVGRLQHDGALPHSHCNELKRSLKWVASGK
jgi:addiction module HigA family antidote